MSGNYYLKILSTCYLKVQLAKLEQLTFNSSTCHLSLPIPLFSNLLKHLDIILIHLSLIFPLIRAINPDFGKIPRLETNLSCSLHRTETEIIILRIHKQWIGKGRMLFLQFLPFTKAVFSELRFTIKMPV